MDSQITVGGLEPDRDDERPPGRSDVKLIAFIAVAAVVGAVLGAAFTSPGSPAADAPTETTTAGIDEPEVVTTTTVPVTTTQPDRLAVRVPGFSDVLVLVSAQLGAQTGTLGWEPSDRGPVDRSLPEVPMEVDAARLWLAGVAESRYLTDNVLWVGNDRWMEPIATDVTGAVWHQRFPGRLAWVEPGDQQSTLVIGTFQTGRPVSTTTAALDTPAAIPVWFGDDGVLVDMGTGSFRLYDAVGSLVAEYDADRFLAGAADVFLLVVDDRVEAVPQLRPTWTTPIDAECTDGEFSPAGDGSLALRCPTDDRWSMQIWYLGIDSATAAQQYSRVANEITAPTWSSDGRFAVAADQDPTRVRSNLVFVEVASWIGREIPIRGIVTSVATVRN
jgi:hypothetical protein